MEYLEVFATNNLGLDAICRPTILIPLGPDTCSVIHRSYFSRPGACSDVRSA